MAGRVRFITPVASIALLAGIVPAIAQPVAPALSATMVASATSAGQGSLKVVVTPSDVSARIKVSGPHGFRTRLSSSSTLKRLKPGRYRVSAGSVEIDGIRVEPSITPTAFRVKRGKTARVRIQYPSPSTPPPNLPPLTPTPAPTPTPPPDTTPPGQIQNLSVDERAADYISLSWTNPTDADLARVIVRRAEGKTPPATPTSGRAVPLADDTDTLVTDVDLSEDLYYSYAFFTRDLNNNTSVTPVTITASTDVTAPGQVTSLTVTDRATDSLSLSWTNPDDPDLREIVVRRAQGGTPPASVNQGVIVGLDDPLAEQVVDDGLQDNTTYSYSVFTKDEVTNVSQEPTTTTSTTDVTPPGSVTSLEVTSRATTSLGLSWSNPADADLAEVIVRRATGATAPGSPTAGVGVTLSSPTATSVTNTGLTNNTTYSYAVFTRDNAGNTAPAATITSSTDVTAPGPVASLTVTSRATDSLSLSWTSPGDGDLAEVIVRRAQGPTPPATATAGTNVTLSSPTAASVTDTGLAEETTYSYAVFTRDTTGNTNTSPTTLTTSTDITAPAPVTDLTVTSRATTSLGLSWSNPADADLAEVIVRRATGATAPGSPTAGVGVTLSSPTATSVTNTGLTNNTTYSYAVFTRDNAGNTRTGSNHHLIH